MIYKATNNTVKELKNVEFKLERDLQNFVENNMYSLIGYKFIVSEFSIENYRFDSVAYDEVNNSFVIVEYKRGKNESLIDQGYAYLKTLLDRKADFVLLYNETFNDNKKKDFFDWSQSKIAFVSPRFTQYQKDATSYGNMPFELYEVTKYEDDLYEVNNLTIYDNTKTQVIDSLETPTMKVVKKEVNSYDEEHILSSATEITKEMYFELKDRIMELGYPLTPSYTKFYMTFKSTPKRNVVDLWMKKDWIEIVLAMKQGELIDNEHIAYDISNRLWSATQYAIHFDKNTDIDYVMELIRQSCKKNC